MVNVLYPRTVSITRPNVPGGSTQVGDGGFSGDDPVNETPILSNIAANIAYERIGRTSDLNTPTDTRKSVWLIALPANAAAKGVIKVRDIVTDDVGIRYAIYAPDWQLLGYQLHCEMLNA